MWWKIVIHLLLSTHKITKSNEHLLDTNECDKRKILKCVDYNGHKCLENQFYFFELNTNFMTLSNTISERKFKGVKKISWVLFKRVAKDMKEQTQTKGQVFKWS